MDAAVAVGAAVGAAVAVDAAVIEMSSLPINIHLSIEENELSSLIIIVCSAGVNDVTF